MHRNTVETIMGAIVLLAAAGFMTLAYEVAGVDGNGGYEITAEFGNTGGLSIGDDVRVSGIKVGRITAQQLDPITYVAKITMAINPAVKIPSDSTARITAASLLGGNYLELMPGAADETLDAGAVIYDTRDPVSLNDLLGKAVFSSGSTSGTSDNTKSN